MTSLALKIEKFAVYIMIVYMATMTGLYFHMDSKISVLQTIQDKTLAKFADKDKNHVDVDTKLSSEIAELSKDFDTLKSDINNQLTTITELILEKSGNTVRSVKPKKG